MFDNNIIKRPQKVNAKIRKNKNIIQLLFYKVNNDYPPQYAVESARLGSIFVCLYTHPLLRDPEGFPYLLRSWNTA
jgi:hypothetical protein